MDGTNLSSVSLVNVSGADLALDLPSGLTLWDNDEGISLGWYIPVGEDSDSSFDGQLRATTGGDGNLDANGVDNHGRSFHAHITVDRTTYDQTIELTIDGLEPEDRHWTGTTENAEEFNGRFPMYSDSLNGSGMFTGLFAACAAECEAQAEQVRTLNATLITNVLDYELLDNYSGGFSGTPPRLNRKPNAVADSTQNQVVALYERQAHTVKYTVDATTNDIAIVSSVPVGTAGKVAIQIPVPRVWVLNQTNMQAYVNYALPAPVWRYADDPNDIWAKVLKKVPPGKLGPVQIRFDSIIQGGQKRN
jgi:hypothetical protein